MGLFFILTLAFVAVTGRLWTDEALSDNDKLMVGIALAAMYLASTIVFTQ